MTFVQNNLDNLNKEQRKAVLHDDGPAVVLAGAGSGKTTVLTKRVGWLIAEKNVSPYSILVVTFTNKAAKEIKQRIFENTGHRLPWSGTFHSLCAKILRIDGSALGLSRNFVIYDSQDQMALMKQIYKDHSFDKDEFNIKAVKAAISNAKNELLTADSYSNIASGGFQLHIAKVFKLYQRELTKASALDFDDLLSKTLHLLKTKKEVREIYQQKFEHVLIDEYQDTNKAQYQLTKILSQPQDNIFVVGDFCQSIYAWRGADYRNMMNLKKSFPKITEFRLEQNYRSNQTILDAATEVISLNTSHPILNLWTEKSAGEKITQFEAESGRNEARQVVRYIRTHSKDTDLGEIAILYRTNAQSREFEEALITSGIPYKLIGGTKFYERKEVKDVIAYLRYSLNVLDMVSYNRILKLGKRRFKKLTEWLKTDKAKNILMENPAVVLKDILLETKYLEKYKNKTEENVDRLANIEELISVASQFEDANQFLENIALIQDNQFADGEKTQTDKHSVNLMSLHSAKGLEFEVVFLVGMEDGILPHSRSLLDNAQMEEERRLCYVGITRAKSKLYLTHARSRFQYGQANSAMSSRFLQDISADLITKESEKKKYNYKDNSGYKKYNNNYNDYYKKGDKPKISASKRRIIVDDDMVEGVLSGDFDIDDLINS